jgi:hypothetical protein
MKIGGFATSPAGLETHRTVDLEIGATLSVSLIPRSPAE